MIEISATEQIDILRKENKLHEEYLEVVNSLKRLQSNNDFNKLYEYFTDNLLKTSVLNITSHDGTLSIKNLETIKGISEFMNFLNMLLNSEKTYLDKISENKEFIAEISAKSGE